MSEQRYLARVERAKRSNLERRKSASTDDAQVVAAHADRPDALHTVDEEETRVEAVSEEDVVLDEDYIIPRVLRIRFVGWSWRSKN